MPLTVKRVEAAKAKEKLYRLSDGRGLYLEVPAKGNKRWRFRYMFGGKAKMLSLGVYPDVSLVKARERCMEFRTMVSDGEDPSQVRREAKVLASGASSFETVAREWHSKFSQTWRQTHCRTVMGRLEKNVFPFIGSRPIRELDASDMLSVVQRIENRGALDTARRTRGICSQVFRYAIVTGQATRDPAADVRGALPPVVKVKHHASITEPKKIGPLLRAIDSFEGTFIVHCALRFAPLVFVRPGELRQAEWTEFDLEAAEWRIPAEKMKMGKDHVVPLSTQAVAVLRELYPLTGSGRYLFPSVRTSARPMSENTINAALRRLGYSKDEMTGHGFRSMASTVLHEQGWPSDVIERQLAHTERNRVKAAYNYAEHLHERWKMMQAWADYLDGLKNKGAVVPIRRVRMDG